MRAADLDPCSSINITKTLTAPRLEETGVKYVTGAAQRLRFCDNEFVFSRWEGEQEAWLEAQ